MAIPTAFQKRLATIVQNQYAKYSLMREMEPALADQIRIYWTDGVAFNRCRES